MPESLHQLIHKNLDTVVELEHELYQRVTPAERLVHRITLFSGRFSVLIFHAAAIAGWIAFNTLAPAHYTLDHWPFDGLILFLACESLLLTLLVLITQRIMQKLDNHRAHLALQLELLAEQETTKGLEILRRLEKHFGLAVPDDNAAALAQSTDTQVLSSAIEDAMKTEKKE